MKDLENKVNFILAYQEYIEGEDDFKLGPYSREVTNTCEEVIKFINPSKRYIQTDENILHIVNKCVNNSKDYIIIKDIEDGIHISYQSKLVQALSNFFPDLKFIIITNAPIIFTNVKDCSIYKYENEEFVEIGYCYGIDYSTAIEDVIGFKYRDSTIENYIRTYYVLKAQECVEAAERIKKEFFDYYGKELPESLLNELTMYD